MGSILDMGELTGGPVFSRIDHGCICNKPKPFQTCGSLQSIECYSIADALAFIDPAFDGDLDTPSTIDSRDICAIALLTGSTANQTVFFQNSILGASGAILQFPQTDVHVILGGLDGSAAYAQALDWTSVVTTIDSAPVVPVCLPQDGHDIPSFQDGAAQIVTDLTTYCVPHH
jgi:hypothetical protein